MRENSNLLKLECLNNNYSTTRLCYKLLYDSYLDENGKIKEGLKLNINNSTFKIQHSKLIGRHEDKFETLLFLPEGEGRKGEGGLRTKGYFKFSYENLIMNDECLILNDENGNEFRIDNSKFKIQNSKLNKLPLISIITVVYNGAKYLEETIQSVINQTYPNVEYIIIDGGSTDGTIDIIKKYEDYIDYWVSEKDRGIADAFNKGIKTGIGFYLFFLNCGDRLYNADSLYKILDLSSSQNKFYDLIVCKIAMVNDNDKILYYTGKKIRLYRQVFRNYLPHQGMLIKKELFKNIGMYDESFALGMDYEWSLRIINKDIKIFFCDKIFSKMLEGGVSQSKYIGTFLAYHRARVKNNIINKYFSFLLSLFFIFKRTIGNCYRKVRKKINLCK